MANHRSSMSSFLSSLQNHSDKNGVSKRHLQVPAGRFSIPASVANTKGINTQSFSQLLDRLQTKYDFLEGRCRDLVLENDRLKKEPLVNMYGSLRSADCSDISSLKAIGPSTPKSTELDVDEFCAMRAQIGNSETSCTLTPSDSPTPKSQKRKGSSDDGDVVGHAASSELARIRFSCVDDSVEVEAYGDAVQAGTPGTSEGGKIGWMRYSEVEKTKIENARYQATTTTLRTDSDFRKNFYSVVIVDNPYFDTCCAVLLITNAVFIGVQVDYKNRNITSKLPVEIVVVDYIYTAWFLFELFLRMSAFGFSIFFCGPDRNWNLFDFFVVGIGTIETVLTFFIDGGSVLSNISAVRSVRAVRVVRILRVIRLMRFFRSLRILVAAIFNTVKSCMWTATLLGIIIYIVGITFTHAVTDHFLHSDETVIADSPETPLLKKYFGSLPRSVFTCLKSILGGIDWEVPVQALSDLGWAYVSFFVFQIVFIYLAVMNVISGLFLQCALEHAQQDKDDMITHQLQEREKYHQRLLALFREIDLDRDGTVTLEDFEQSLRDERMLAFLEALDIQANDAWTLFKLLDREGGGCVSLECFVDGCFELRGVAKAIHIAQLVYDTKWMMEGLSELTFLIERYFTEVSNMAHAPIVTKAT